MQGLPVQCPQCKRKSFITTEHFKPIIPPNGSMLKSTLQYQHDWLCTSSTKGPELTCPECLAPLAPGGVLNVLVPIRDVGEFCHDNPGDMFIKQEEGISADDFVDFPDAPPELPPVDAPKVGKPVHICEICGKECSTALALNGHKRSHKK